MARTSMLVALVAVVAAVAARHAELRQNSTDKIVRPSDVMPIKCPLFLAAIACTNKGLDSCESSVHCNEGDECCLNTCNYDCYNGRTGFYRGTLGLCPPVPMVLCDSLFEECNTKKRCGAGKVCCPVSCGTACITPRLGPKVL